ncbi:hypothetical protein CEXT_71321 [Caerostris extrusa]|uniref:Uncharacterized protein n=1 Tax=Caerostris extrusa TaxID=172846 RepID=A0AAV4U5F3_CAEEX|nr:hypothetical protein CEXT_71321 [Caerostris extrusa]
MAIGGRSFLDENGVNLHGCFSRNDKGWLEGGSMKNLSTPPPLPDKANAPRVSYLWCDRAHTALFVIGAPCRRALPGLNGLRYKLDGAPDKMRIFSSRVPCLRFASVDPPFL